jgi:hypothetical protein
MEGIVLVGKVEKETEKAVLLDGDWLPRSVITNILALQTFSDGDPKGRVLVGLKFDPRRLRVKDSLHADAETVDGRRWHKQGLLGWREIS